MMHDAIPVAADELTELREQRDELLTELSGLADAFDALHADYINALGIAPRISANSEAAHAAIARCRK